MSSSSIRLFHIYKLQKKQRPELGKNDETRLLFFLSLTLFTYPGLNENLFTLEGGGAVGQFWYQPHENGYWKVEYSSICWPKTLHITRFYNI